MNVTPVPPSQLLAMAPDSLTFAKLCAMGVTGDNIVITTRTFGVRQLVPVTGVNQLLGTDFRVGPPYMVAVYNANMLVRILAMPDVGMGPLAGRGGGHGEEEGERERERRRGRRFGARACAYAWQLGLFPHTPPSALRRVGCNANFLI